MKGIVFVLENYFVESSSSSTSSDKDKKTKNKRNIKEKFGFLWKDKRSFTKRCITACIVSFLFVYTFMIFGPFEIYASNMGFLSFSVKYLIPPMIIVGTGAFLVLSLFLSFLKGKIYNYFVSVVFSLSVAGYIQGNFINVDHGSLDGTEILWTDYKSEAFFNIMLWAFIIIIPFVIQYFSRKLWKNIIRIVSVILIGAQTVALVVILFTTSFTDVSDNGFFTREGIYELSQEKNVVVFLLDKFDKRYAERQFELDPELINEFKGFTFYDNFTGSYSRTCPSVTYLLTGVKCDYDIPMEDYFNKAWTEGSFLRDIKEAGYDTKIYSDINYVMGSSSFVEDVITNIGQPTGKANKAKILSAMYNLSIYRYAPEMMKPYYHVYTDDISYDYIYESNGKIGDIYSLNDIFFRQELEKNRLTESQNRKGSFVFYHLQGAHEPYRMDENGEEMTGHEYSETGRNRQIRGNLNTVFMYIEELKEKGLYDNTTIIITSDHGRTGFFEELSEDGKTGGETGGERTLSLFIKPAGADRNADMVRSHKQICQDNLRASMISYFGLDTSAYADTIEDIGENEERVRYFYMNGCNALKTKRDYNLITYKIVGDANDFDNWEKISKERIKYPYYDSNK